MFDGRFIRSQAARIVVLLALFVLAGSAVGCGSTGSYAAAPPVAAIRVTPPEQFLARYNLPDQAAVSKAHVIEWHDLHIDRSNRPVIGRVSFAVSWVCHPYDGIECRVPAIHCAFEPAIGADLRGVSVSQPRLRVEANTYAYPIWSHSLSVEFTIRLGDSTATLERFIVADVVRQQHQTSGDVRSVAVLEEAVSSKGRRSSGALYWGSGYQELVDSKGSQSVGWSVHPSYGPLAARAVEAVECPIDNIAPGAALNRIGGPATGFMPAREEDQVAN
jgi:hypothetical protein